MDRHVTLLQTCDYNYALAVLSPIYNGAQSYVDGLFTELTVKIVF